MDCKPISELLAAYLDGEVTPEERGQIEAHLSACPQCREELEALATTQKGLRQMLKEAAAGVAPPAESWNRIKQRAGIKNRVERPSPKRRFPALVTVPLSIFLLIVLAGGFLAGMGYMVLPGAKALPPPEPPSLVGDGSGGAFVFWNGTPYSFNAGLHYSTGVYANYVDAKGNYLWGVEGKQIATGEVSPPLAVSDGVGGAVVAWGGGEGIYAQRMNSEGDSVWDDEKALVWAKPAGGWHSLVGMIADGEGGAILLRQDSNEQVYAQRISAEGVTLWEEGGTNIGRIQFAYMGMPIVSDGSGGAAIVWEEYSGEGIALYAQRISQDGELLWSRDGVSATTIVSEKEKPQLINDGTGGFIIVWTDISIATDWDEDIYAQKLDAEGQRMWGEQGIPISVAPGRQSNPQITADGSGGCIIAWPEIQYADVKSSVISAQRINSSGEILWQEGGVPVSNIQDSPILNLGFIYIIIIGNGDGSSTVIWVADKDSGGQQARQAYSQKLDPDGQLLWPEGRVEAYRNPPFRTIGYSSVISDDSGGFIIGSRVSEGSNISRTDSVYIQRVDSAGNRLWGESGVEIQMKHSSPLLPIIAVVVILITALILFGVFRGNRLAGIFTAVAPVIIGITALFGNSLLTGSLPFFPSAGYSHGWAYILITPADLVSAAVIPVAALAIGAVGIWKRAVTRWATIPVVVFCALVAFIVESLIISNFF